MPQIPDSTTIPSSSEEFLTQADLEDFATDAELAAAIVGLSDTQVVEVDAAITAKMPYLNVRDYGALGDGATDDTTAIQAAIDAAAGGGTVVFPPGTYKISSITLASKSNIWLRGSGVQATTLIPTATTGNVFDFTSALFCGISDATIACQTERTAGALFYFDHGGGINQSCRVERLWIYGGYRVFHLDDCGLHTIRDIQIGSFADDHDMHSIFHLAGQTVSCEFSSVRGGSSAPVSAGFIYIDGAETDTIFFNKFDVVSYSPSTGTPMVVIAAGEWLYFTDCSFEAGDETAVAISGDCMGINFTACHVLGDYGYLTSGGRGVRIIGGEILVCQKHGVLHTAGTHYEFIGVTFSNLSQETTGTYSGVQVTANVTDFSIVDCHFGDMLLPALTPDMATAITVAAGTSNRYVIRGNRIGTTGVNFPIADLGTGTDKVIEGNVFTDSGTPTVASAAALDIASFNPSAEVFSISGTTSITSMTAGAKGRRVTLIFQGALTFTDGSNLKLAGNLVTTADDTITLVCDGTNWYETGRSVN